MRFQKKSGIKELQPHDVTIFSSLRVSLVSDSVLSILWLSLPVSISPSLAILLSVTGAHAVLSRMLRDGDAACHSSAAATDECVACCPHCEHVTFTWPHTHTPFFSMYKLLQSLSTVWGMGRDGFKCVYVCPCVCFVVLQNERIQSDVYPRLCLCQEETRREKTKREDVRWYYSKRGKKRLDYDRIDETRQEKRQDYNRRGYKRRKDTRRGEKRREETRQKRWEEKKRIEELRWEEKWWEKRWEKNKSDEKTREEPRQE